MKTITISLVQKILIFNLMSLLSKVLKIMPLALRIHSTPYQLSFILTSSLLLSINILPSKKTISQSYLKYTGNGNNITLKKRFFI